MDSFLVQALAVNPAPSSTMPVLYPEGKVTKGGLTDRLLSDDYPNMYGDLSAGSGHNALTCDEDHARQFFIRHQDKLMAVSQFFL